MDSQDDSGGGQWLTYEEIAEARGIKRLAAVRLTQRHRWRRQRGNDGHARVLVPHDMLQRDRGDSDDDKAGDSHRDSPTLLAAIRAAHLGETTALREQVEALKGEVGALREAHAGEAGALRSRLEDAEGRAERAEAAISGERQRADSLRDRLDAAQADLDRASADAQAVLQRAEALEQAEKARQARGRLRRAWDGWRGR
jgi:hypothetical protein